MGFQKILAAIDHSPLCQAVFEQALELAKSNRARLMLFHCLTADTVTLTSSLLPEMGMSHPLVNQSYQTEYMRLDQQTRHIQVLLAHYTKLATEQGVSVESSYRITEAGQGLCQEAERWKADLIVMGRRGRKGITEVLLGSVSNYVLHHANCAVLIIQSGSEIPPQSPSVASQETIARS